MCNCKHVILIVILIIIIVFGIYYYSKKNRIINTFDGQIKGIESEREIVIQNKDYESKMEEEKIKLQHELFIDDINRCNKIKNIIKRYECIDNIQKSM